MKVGLINTATGEVFEKVDMRPMPRVVPVDDYFVKLKDYGSTMLAMSDLSGADYKVFFALCKRLQWENLVLVRANEIAEELGMKRSSVSRSVSKLVQAAIFEKTGEKLGTWPYLRLNEKIGWKGRQDNQRKQENIRKNDSLRGAAEHTR